MIEFNVYFCIKHGKIASFSAWLHGLSVRRETNSLMYHTGDNVLYITNTASPLSKAYILLS